MARAKKPRKTQEEPIERRAPPTPLPGKRSARAPTSPPGLIRRRRTPPVTYGTLGRPTTVDVSKLPPSVPRDAGDYFPGGVIPKGKPPALPPERGGGGRRLPPALPSWRWPPKRYRPVTYGTLGRPTTVDVSKLPPSVPRDAGDYFPGGVIPIGKIDKRPVRGKIDKRPVRLLAKGGATKPKLTKAQGVKASAKISHLAKSEPTMPAKQRIAMALNMAREGRLGPAGAYKPKKARGRAKK